MLGGLKIDPVVFHFTHEKENRHIIEHNHRFAELSWMLSGSMEYLIGNKKQKITCDGHDFIFIPPEIAHQRNCQGGEANIIGFMLDLAPHNEKGRMFLNKINSLLTDSEYIFTSLPFFKKFENKLLDELRGTKGIYIGKINFLIYEFLFKLFSHFFADYLIVAEEAHKITYDRHNLVVSAQDYIEKNLDSDLGLSFFAHRYNVSPRHLNRIFSEQTGIPLKQYILQRKLNAAQKMLYNPKFSVKEIAYKLGFQRDSYFSHFFKKHTDMTPLEYAKQLNKN